MISFTNLTTPAITVELVAATNIQKIVRGYLIRRFAYILKMGGPGSFIVDNCRMLWKEKGPTMFWYKALCKCRERLEKSREEYMLLEKLYNEQKTELTRKDDVLKITRHSRDPWALEISKSLCVHIAAVNGGRRLVIDPRTLF